ncbi:FAD-binding oxidoreductase [Rhodococcus aerolatus]
MDTTSVALVRGTLERVGERSDELTARLYARLFALEPETRAMFPASMAVQRHRLLAALDHVVAVLDRPEQLEPFLRRLGRDHHKLDVSPQQVASLGVALEGALRDVLGTGWDERAADAWREAFALVADLMAEGDAGVGGPRRWTATVVERLRVADDVAVVRLQVDRDPGAPAGSPVPAMAAGQYLSVSTDRRPGLWRTYSPATAPDPGGQVELHVRTVPGGWVSGSVVGHTRPGDRWTLATPMGALRVDRASGRDVLMVAGGTGLAPMRSLLLELARSGGAPRVHLFVGGRHPGDLYDLPALAELARRNPWLTVVPVVETLEAPWTRVPPPPRPDGTHQPLVGRLVDVVTGFGAWDDRQALVSGSPAMVRATVTGLVARGMPAHQVWRDPLPPAH